MDECGYSKLSLSTAIVLWVCVYVSLRYLTKFEPEATSRLVALLHAVMVTTMGATLCFGGQNQDDEDRLNDPMATSHFVLFTISFGYFVYDLCFCLWQGKETKLMIVHHIYSVGSLLRLLVNGTLATTASCGIAALELTNPLLQTRWFLRAAGYGNTIFFYIVEGVFISTFIILRGVFGTYLLLNILFDSRMDIESKTQATLIHLISLGFIYNMFKYVRGKYFYNKPEIRRSITRSNPVVQFSNDQVVNENISQSHDD